MHRLGLVVLSAWLASGCILFELRHAKTPLLQLEDVRVQDITFDEATVVARVDVGNPNNFGISLAESDASLLLGTARLLDVTLPNGFDLVANGHSPAVLSIRVKYALVPDLAKRVGAGEKEAPYTVEATVRFKTSLGDLAVPLKFHGNLPLPQPPTVRFERVDVGALGLGGMRLNVHLAVDNPNVFPLPFGSVQARLMDGDRSLATVETKTGPMIAPKATTDLAIPVEVGLLSAGGAIVAGVQSRHAAVRLQGTISLAGRALPIDLQANVR